ncbi:hypothetical protein NQD34_013434, partial [Periophthalmus magnuspinnatus]
LLLLPLFLSVLYVGYRQKQKKQPPFSHTDIFTFNIVAMEIITIFGTSSYSLGIQVGELAITRVGSYLFDFGVTGQMCIHSLTCVERYLAVVHPVTYLRLKKRGGVMIRDISIAAAWLVCAGVVSVTTIPKTENTDKISIIGVTILSVLIVSFCSVSVLCVLIRPGPTKGGGDSKRVDQLKRRAFVTMVAILGMLLLRSVLLVSAYMITILNLLEFELCCVLNMSVSWFYLPSSLV